MSKRLEIMNAFYNGVNEDARLNKSRHGQLEFETTMSYIHRFTKDRDKILEIGAGTGKYSITLAKEGYEVTAIELVEHNLEILRNNSRELKSLLALQGDSLNLSLFSDNKFDVTLVFGPLYHLYNQLEVHKAIDEAIRVTKKGGVILVAFLSVYSIMYSNYLQGNLEAGLNENYTLDYQVKHFEEQLFTGYDIVEFEQLFLHKDVKYITTVAVDNVLELAEERNDFKMSDEEFNLFTKYHFATCEKRELLGTSNHLLYICRKIK